MRLSRRRLLGTAATGFAGGVAGCSDAFGLDARGERRWERSMAVVPMVGGERSGRYRPPATLAGSASRWFVAGFEGTNVLSEFGVGSGRRTWRLHLDVAFLSLRRVGSALYAVDETGVTKVAIE